MHHSKSNTVDGTEPEIIEYYNKTKGGVDSLDKKCACQQNSPLANAIKMPVNSNAWTF